jgi:hypothetical protein
MENSKKHILHDKINVVEESAVEYITDNKEFDDIELHPILIQLLEKAIIESEEGIGSTTEEVMNRAREKYPFLK